MRPLLKKKSTYLLLAAILIAIALSVFAIQHWILSQNNNTEKLFDKKLVLANHQTIHILHKQEPEKGVIIYIADTHTNKSSAEYARKFADLSYYVVTIDNQFLLNTAGTASQSCVNLAEKLLDISRQVQTAFTIDPDYLPIIVGDHEGASLVYAALAQANKNSFHAGVSINFSPQLKTKNALCPTNNFESVRNADNIQIQPVKYLPSSWYVFQNKSIAQDTKAFIYKTHNARLTVAEAENESELDEAIQILQWLDPRLADQISSDNSDSDLPIIEVPAAENDQPVMALILTGDGGWAEIDKSIAKILSEKGIPTLALDSLSYFWRARTAEETTKDIEDMIIQYREKWHKQQVILIGYSFGADVLPFIANRLSPETQKNIALVALLGMGKTAAFKFRLSSWLSADDDPSRLPIFPELKNMTWIKSICIYGEEDDESSCADTAALGVGVIKMTGDHHFDEKYDELVQHIIDNATHTVPAQ